MAVEAVTLAERPDLRGQGVPDEQVWPEYNLHGDVLMRLWPRLYDDLPEFQCLLRDEHTGEVVAEANTAPCWWDGTPGGLSEGIDATVTDVFERLDTAAPVNTLCALAAKVVPNARGQGLASTVLVTMGRIAASHGFAYLVAPVRPSWKERYPITPIERYVTWRRDDGMLLDPWMRVHERLGARLGPALPRSLRITGTVADWESWTGLMFPESGQYVFPQALAPVTIDRAADQGRYWEPNVWMIHPL